MATTYDDPSDYDKIYKVLMIGDSGVGKSSLLLRYCDDMFQETFISTIGVDFKIKTVLFNGKKIKLHIWDTAGQERFRSIITTYYRGAHGIIVTYDVTDITTFSNLTNWLTIADRYCNEETVKIMVGCKSDRPERMVSEEMAKEFSKLHNIPSFECSSKTNSGVNEVFLGILKECETKHGNVASNKRNVALGAGSALDKEKTSNSCAGSSCILF
eukprot:TRINITY_DN2702_c0_g1_i1.p1 TRINITY_DN2702_c0_g1~~TRINITY_DN2702_c0_g1_i1.p1  ORF type:complete len:214 (-),score=40.72 TRINITY_DN2702_c0_g1_i1:51-692(-)